MNKYILTNKAVDDLASIWNYTFDEWSEKQADKYYDMLVNSFQEIALSPERGRNYSSIKENLFGTRAIRHIIFYRKLSQNEIEITRILHESMDLKKRMLE